VAGRTSLAHCLLGILSFASCSVNVIRRPENFDLLIGMLGADRLAAAKDGVNCRQGRVKGGRPPCPLCFVVGDLGQGVGELGQPTLAILLRLFQRSERLLQIRADVLNWLHGISGGHNLTGVSSNA
jgi:hypothetical protein